MEAMVQSMGSGLVGCHMKGALGSQVSHTGE